MLAVCLLFFSLIDNVWSLEVPGHLNLAERQEVLTTLGAATSSRWLSNPYPLGGYQGLEVGVSFENIDTRNISQLGDKQAKPESDFRISRVTIGKGLYNDIDVFFHVVTFTSSRDFSSYGGILKWTFLEGQYLPFTISILAHGASTRINEVIQSRTYGMELLAGMTVDNISLYVGGGPVRTQGEFMAAGVRSLIDPNDSKINSQNLVRSEVRNNHFYGGLSAHFQNLFTAVQVDRYRDSVLSAKVGVRF